MIRNTSIQLTFTYSQLVKNVYEMYIGTKLYAKRSVFDKILGALHASFFPVPPYSSTVVVIEVVVLAEAH